MRLSAEETGRFLAADGGRLLLASIERGFGACGLMNCISKA